MISTLLGSVDVNVDTSSVNSDKFIGAIFLVGAAFALTWFVTKNWALTILLLALLAVGISASGGV